MTYEERNNFVAILTNLVINFYFLSLVLPKALAGEYDGAGGLAAWAQAVLWIIPASIVATIIATILFNIAYAIITRDPNPSYVVDERDKSIAVTGLRVTLVVGSAGFILAIVALAFFGWTAMGALLLIYGGFAGGDLAGNVTKLYLYRRGY